MEEQENVNTKKKTLYNVNYSSSSLQVETKEKIPTPNYNQFTIKFVLILLSILTS